MGQPTRTSATGVTVNDHASLGRSNVTIKNFNSGLVVAGDSHADCQGSTVNNFSGTGVSISEHSFASLQGLQVDGSGGATTGISASLGSTID